MEKNVCKEVITAQDHASGLLPIGKIETRLDDDFDRTELDKSKRDCRLCMMQAS